MFLKLLVGFYIYSYAGLFTPSLSSEEFRDLDFLVTEDSGDKIDALLTGREINEETNDMIMSSLFKEINGGIRPCRTSAANALLKHKFKPAHAFRSKTQTHLNLALMWGCEEIAAAFLKESTPDTIAQSKILYNDFVYEKLAKLANDEINGNVILPRDVEAMKKFGELSKPIANRTKELCEKEAHQGACQAIKHTEETQAKVAKLTERNQKALDYKDSAEYIVKLACEVNEELAENEASLKNEKEARNISGVVDMAVLHKAGKNIHQARKALDMYSADYKKKTGKKLNLAKCP